ncbi:MAG: hypothetical protein IH809_03440 [Proteobacteria bacterium]|nr:hypothetical protein [Pseudomonadota bacterium]
MGYSVADFVSDVGAILRARGETVEAEWEIGPLLQRLVAEGGDLSQQGEAGTGSSGLPSRVLHVDPEGRFRLIVASFPSEQPTPVAVWMPTRKRPTECTGS